MKIKLTARTLLSFFLTLLLLISVVACDSSTDSDPDPTDVPEETTDTSEETAETNETDETADMDDDDTVFFFIPAELSGSGATVGNNWNDGVTLAIEDINDSGGILGRQIAFEASDTQSDPPTSKSVIAKGLEQDPYAIVGPVFSSSIIVNMVEAQRANVMQIVGGEAASLTQQGNPYIFRTSFGQSTSMPKIANYLDSQGIESVDVLWGNDEFGKGGRDAFVAEMDRLEIDVINDISSEQQQADFAPEVLTALASDADALFVYMHEEESARLLVELQEQGFDKPVYGETVLLAQVVLDLAGEAANGALGHVGLSAAAPIDAIEDFASRFEAKYGYTPDHNGIKGYIAAHVIKEMTERMGEFDTEKMAEMLHCTTITTEDEPGVLMDIVYDENGDVDRESFLAEVIDGAQVITEVLPRLGTTCGEQ